VGFHDYQMQHEVWRSAIAVVYGAVHVPTGRRVCVEVIRGVWLRGQDIGPRSRHLAKLEAVALLSHPNVWPILEVGEIDGALYAVNPALDRNGFLAERVEQGRVPPRQAAVWVEQVAGGVQHAHDHGIFHRNIKPGNVVLTAAGVAQLTGFGCSLVRFLRTPEPGTDTVIVGTPSFMAPEQALGRAGAFEPGIDVWGLGALLYTLLAGQPPFRAASTLDTVMAVVHQETPALRDLEPSVERDLEAICLKCLKKKREDRYASAAEVAEDLRRYQRGEPTGLVPSASLSRRMGEWVRWWWG
jgi:serine/threonine-protein kinase